MNNYKQLIYEKFQNRYEDTMNEKFDNFYENIYRDMGINKASSISNILTKTIRPTKKRWIKIILNDKNSSYNKDLNSVVIQYKKIKSGELDKEKFKKFFGINSMEEYDKLQYSQLKKWETNDDLYLTDFKYIKDMKNKSILSAFKNDIYLFYLRCIEEYSIKNNNITKVPTILSEIPIDTSCKVDYLTEAQKKNLEFNDVDNQLTTLDRLISLDGEEQEEVLMKLEKNTYLEIKQGGNPDKYLDMMTQIALLKSIKYLNSFDTKIITYYYNNFLHVVTNAPIIQSFYEIIKDLGLPNTTYYYEALEDCFAKIGSINMTYNIEGNRMFGNILSCFIYNENGTKKVRVHLGAVLQDLAYKGSAFEYDKDLFNKLSSGAQQLAIWLQKRRYTLAIKSGDTKESISLKTYSNAIYFTTKRADRKRNKIIEYLDELSSVKLIIEKYTYEKKADISNLEYIPLSIQEKKKLKLLDDDIVGNTDESQLDTYKRNEMESLD
ncbi:hypothetical protein [Clostridium neonatale]|uniref:hypothetical protein n=1 Tax=Clostridium neonatale TaxID=137838 RepID=UPI00291C3095|nr:conserved hypothetical protein [Clostridium neonatale]CAI3629179.1 conserved hypothetical protein [Clostridium neonatale]CAI3632860.1 conserved hypothetical protein [Clostridium neonatale]CAI3634449.1 conserved hypothetical protein [Clostridium neonatale]CAI3667641.1 conserved hypothetical protein [Clostridium neonatale]